MDATALVQQLLIGRFGDKLLSQEIMTSEGLVLAANAATSDDGATWRSLDTAKSSWRLVLDLTNDRAIVQRAAATTGNLTWVVAGLRVPSAGLSMSANQSFANGATSVVNLNTTQWDRLGGFADPANNRLVIPVAGIYAVELGGNWNTNATGMRNLQLRKNAAALAFPAPEGIDMQPGNAVERVSLGVSLQQPFVAGDALDATGYQNSGGSLLFLASRGYLQATLVSY